MTFYFAWCDSDQPFDDSMLREDEIVFAFDIAHQEGQIPTLSIDIKNPHVGLLAPGRSQWAWLSYLDPIIGVVPLFYGWIVGLPSNLLGEVVTLQFLARPSDYLAQKQDIANSLMMQPYYDPIWIDPSKLADPSNPDPDTVLETYTVAWHVDRTSLLVSISDIISGEDGTEVFNPEDSFYDTVAISFAQSPLTQVVFDGTIQWTQAATDVINMPDVSLSAWNGQQIVNDWPKPGDQLDGGWSVEGSAITNWSDQFGSGNSTVIDLGGGTSSNIGGTGTTTTVTGSATQGPGAGFTNIQSNLPKTSLAKSISYSFQNQAKTHSDGDTMSVNESGQYDEEGKMGGKIVSYNSGGTYGDPATGTAASAFYNVSYTRLKGQYQTAPATAPPAPSSGDGTQDGGPITVPGLFGQLSFRYNLSFDRTETFNFVMTSDIQPIVLLPPDDSINQITLSMSGSDVGLPLDDDGTTAPIGDPSRSAFFPTDRGLLAMQYPMLVARANLVQSARAVKVNFDCTFERALYLSCRKSAVLFDSRLPGGQVNGKITEYHLKADGDKGQLTGSVQIESVVGNGTTIVVNEGEPDYVDDDYVTPDYQFYSGADLALPTDDATIVIPPISLVDDEMVLPLTFNDAVMVFQVHNGTPVDTVIAGGAATADPTWLEIVLMPVTGQKFSTNYDLGSSTLVLPKLIDLAAPSA
jgi:hypothetical protein